MEARVDNPSHPRFVMNKVSACCFFFGQKTVTFFLLQPRRRIIFAGLRSLS